MFMIQIKPKNMICVQPLYCIINNKNKYSPSFKNYFLIQQSDSCHLQKSEVLTRLDCFTAVSLVNISVNINQHPCPNCSHLSIATRYKRSAKTSQQKHFMRMAQAIQWPIWSLQQRAYYIIIIYKLWHTSYTKNLQ